MADLFRPVGTVTAFKDIGIPPSTRPHGISRQSFLVYPLDLHMRITVAFLDFVTFGPLILRMRLGIKFLFVRLRFRYPFFSPTPHDINLGNRFKVRRQLRPGGLSPQTDGMPVIPKRQSEVHLIAIFVMSESSLSSVRSDSLRIFLQFQIKLCPR